MDINETLALLGTGAEISLNAGKTATAMKTIIGRFNTINDRETSTTGQWLYDYFTKNGITFTDEETGQLDFYQMVKSMGEHWESMSLDEQSLFSQKMSGSRQASNWANWMLNIGNLDEMKRVAESQSQGSAAKSNEAMMNSIEGAQSRLAANSENFFSSAINSDVIIGGINALSTAMGALNKIPFASTAAGIGTIAMAFGGIATYVPTLVKFLGGGAMQGVLGMGGVALSGASGLKALLTGSFGSTALGVGLSNFRLGYMNSRNTSRIMGNAISGFTAEEAALYAASFGGAVDANGVMRDGNGKILTVNDWDKMDADDRKRYLSAKHKGADITLNDEGRSYTAKDKTGKITTHNYSTVGKASNLGRAASGAASAATGFIGSNIGMIAGVIGVAATAAIVSAIASNRDKKNQIAVENFDKLLDSQDKAVKQQDEYQLEMRNAYNESVKSDLAKEGYEEGSEEYNEAYKNRAWDKTTDMAKYEAMEGLISDQYDMSLKSYKQIQALVEYQKRQIDNTLGATVNASTAGEGVSGMFKDTLFGVMGSSNFAETAEEAANDYKHYRTQQVAADTYGNQLAYADIAGVSSNDKRYTNLQEKQETALGYASGYLEDYQSKLSEVSELYFNTMERLKRASDGTVKGALDRAEALEKEGKIAKGTTEGLKQLTGTMEITTESSYQAAAASLGIEVELEYEASDIKSFITQLGSDYDAVDEARQTLANLRGKGWNDWTGEDLSKIGKAFSFATEDQLVDYFSNFYDNTKSTADLDRAWRILSQLNLEEMYGLEGLASFEGKEKYLLKYYEDRGFTDADAETAAIEVVKDAKAELAQQTTEMLLEMTSEQYSTFEGLKAIQALGNGDIAAAVEALEYNNENIEDENGQKGTRGSKKATNKYGETYDLYYDSVEKFSQDLNDLGLGMADATALVAEWYDLGNVLYGENGEVLTLAQAQSYMMDNYTPAIDANIAATDANTAAINGLTALMVIDNGGNPVDYGYGETEQGTYLTPEQLESGGYVETSETNPETGNPIWINPNDTNYIRTTDGNYYANEDSVIDAGYVADSAGSGYYPKEQENVSWFQDEEGIHSITGFKPGMEGYFQTPKWVSTDDDEGTGYYKWDYKPSNTTTMFGYDAKKANATDQYTLNVQWDPVNLRPVVTYTRKNAGQQLTNEETERSGGASNATATPTSGGATRRMGAEGTNYEGLLTNHWNEEYNLPTEMSEWIYGSGNYKGNKEYTDLYSMQQLGKLYNQYSGEHVFGNIDLTNRQLLPRYDNGELVGYSTVSGGSMGITNEKGQTAEMAYSQIQQTANGPVEWSTEEVGSYLNDLVYRNGGNFDDNLYKLDTAGLLAGYGDDAAFIGAAMHDIALNLEAQGNTNYVDLLKELGIEPLAGIVPSEKKTTTTTTETEPQPTPSKTTDTTLTSKETNAYGNKFAEAINNPEMIFGAINNLGNRAGLILSDFWNNPIQKQPGDEGYVPTSLLKGDMLGAFEGLTKSGNWSNITDAIYNALIPTASAGVTGDYNEYDQAYNAMMNEKEEEYYQLQLAAGKVELTVYDKNGNRIGLKYAAETQQRNKILDSNLMNYMFGTGTGESWGWDNIITGLSPEEFSQKHPVISGLQRAAEIYLDMLNPDLNLLGLVGKFFGGTGEAGINEARNATDAAEGLATSAALDIGGAIVEDKASSFLDKLFQAILPSADAGLAGDVEPWGETQTDIGKSTTRDLSKLKSLLDDSSNKLTDAFALGYDTSDKLGTSSDKLQTSFDTGEKAGDKVQQASDTLKNSTSNLKDTEVEVKTDIDESGIDDKLTGGKVEYKAEVEDVDTKDELKGGTVKYKSEVEKPKADKVEGGTVTYKAQLDTSSLKGSMKASSVKVTADTGAATSAIGAVNSELNTIQPKSVTVTATDNASATLGNIVNKLNSINSRSITITTNYVTNGTPPAGTKTGGIIGVNAPNPINIGERHADGGTVGSNGMVGTWLGDEYEGKGEKKPELVVTPDGNAHIAGLNGWEYEQLPKGTRVYSNKETRSMLGSNYDLGNFGHRHADGGEVKDGEDRKINGRVYSKKNYDKALEKKNKQGERHANGGFVGERHDSDDRYTLVGDMTSSSPVTGYTAESTSSSSSSSSSSANGASGGSGNNTGSTNTNNKSSSSTGDSSKAATANIEGYVKDIKDSIKTLVEQYDTMVKVITDQIDLLEVQEEKTDFVSQERFDLEKKQIETLNNYKAALEKAGATVENSEDYRDVLKQIAEAENQMVEQEQENMSRWVDVYEAQAEDLEDKYAEYNNPQIYAKELRDIYDKELEQYDTMRMHLLENGYSEFSEEVMDIEDKIRDTHESIREMWENVIEDISDAVSKKAEEDESYFNHYEYLYQQAEDAVDKLIAYSDQVYDDETEIIEKQDKEIERNKRLIDAQADLDDAKKKRVMYMTEEGWQWKENPEAVRDALKAYNDAVEDIEREIRDETREEEHKLEQLNIKKQLYGEESGGKEAYATEDSIYSVKESIDNFKDSLDDWLDKMFTEMEFGNQDLEGLGTQLLDINTQKKISDDHIQDEFMQIISELGYNAEDLVVETEDGNIDMQLTMTNIAKNFSRDDMSRLQKMLFDEGYYIANAEGQVLDAVNGGFTNTVPYFNALINAYNNGWDGMQTQFGNIDLTNRLILGSLVAGQQDYSTVIGSYNSYLDKVSGQLVDIAYSPLLLNEGDLDEEPTLLNEKQVNEYINWLIDLNGGKIDEGILELDKIGNGYINNIIAAVGEDAGKISELMHFVGVYLDQSGENQNYNSRLVSDNTTELQKQTGILQLIAVNTGSTAEEVGMNTTKTVEATKENTQTTTEQTLKQENNAKETIDKQEEETLKTKSFVEETREKTEARLKELEGATDKASLDEIERLEGVIRTIDEYEGKNTINQEKQTKELTSSIDETASKTGRQNTKITAAQTTALTTQLDDSTTKTIDNNNLTTTKQITSSNVQIKESSQLLVDETKKGASASKVYYNEASASLTSIDYSSADTAENTAISAKSNQEIANSTASTAIDLNSNLSSGKSKASSLTGDSVLLNSSSGTINALNIDATGTYKEYYDNLRDLGITIGNNATLTNSKIKSLYEAASELQARTAYQESNTLGNNNVYSPTITVNTSVENTNASADDIAAATATAVSNIVNGITINAKQNSKTGSYSYNTTTGKTTYTSKAAQTYAANISSSSSSSSSNSSSSKTTSKSKTGGKTTHL